MNIFFQFLIKIYILDKQNMVVNSYRNAFLQIGVVMIIFFLKLFLLIAPKDIFNFKAVNACGPSS